MASQHKAVRELIRDTVMSIRDDIHFSYASAFRANSMKNKNYPFVRLDPLREEIKQVEDVMGMTKTYHIGLVFYKPDDPKGEEDATNQILDDLDEITDKFLALMTTNFNETGSETVTQGTILMQSIKKEPVIKVLADVLSGWILTFDLVVNDTFDYCSVQ